MSADLYRPSSRLARAIAGALLALVALAPVAGGFSPGRDAAPPANAGAAASPLPPFSQAQTPAPGQSSADKLFQSGVAALNAKDYAAAEEAFRQCRELEPKNIRGLMGLAEAYLAQKMSDQAIHLLETESAADPGNQDLATALGNIYVRTEKWDQAISQFQKLLDATDKQTKAAGELYLRIGETYRRKGDMPSAISALRNARMTLPDDVRVLSTLALTLDAVSSWEAQQAYEDALRVAPNDAILMNNLAFSLAEHGGDLDRALSLARRAQKLVPTVPEIADTVGWIYLKKDMAYEARAAFAPLVQKQPGNAGFRGHLATALEWRNETSPALRALAKALRQEPTEANQRLVLELLKNSGLPVSR